MTYIRNIALTMTAAAILPGCCAENTTPEIQSLQPMYQTFTIGDGNKSLTDESKAKLDSLGLRVTVVPPSEAEITKGCYYEGPNEVLLPNNFIKNVVKKKGFHHIGVRFDGTGSLYAVKPNDLLETELAKFEKFDDWKNEVVKKDRQSAWFDSIRVITGAQNSYLDHVVKNKSVLFIRLNNSNVYFDPSKTPFEIVEPKSGYPGQLPFFIDEAVIGTTSKGQEWVAVPFYNDGSLESENGGPCRYAFNLNVVSMAGSMKTQITIDPVIINDGGG